MAVSFKTRKNIKKSNNKQDIGFQIIFFALNFLLVPFSAIATYKGYKGFLDEYLAVVLAAATALLFFGLNFLIMQRRQKGENHLKQSLGFLLPLLISFFGNFTYFYGNQMEGTLLNKDLTHYSNTIDGTYLTAKSGLERSTGLNALEVKLNGELALLKNQMEGQKGFEGYGKESDKIWRKITALFSDYNKDYNEGATTRLTEVHDKKKYTNFENTALSYFKSLRLTKGIEIQRKTDELTALYDPVNQEAELLLKSGNEDQLKLNGVDAIKKIRQANNQIGKTSKGFLTNSSFTELEDYEGVNAKNIKSVLTSAFAKRDNDSATIFAIVLSLVIDLATLGFVFLALSYNKQKKQILSGPRQL